MPPPEVEARMEEEEVCQGRTVKAIQDGGERGAEGKPIKFAMF